MKRRNFPRMGRSIWLLVLSALAVGGCEPNKPYGTEARLALPANKRQVWAVAPALNLSGQSDVDPLLQADDLFEQLQQIDGLTVIPVNRVAEVYAGLRIDSVKSAEQASLVCDLLGCDALIVPTITVFDPYNPPKLGASLQLFRKPTNYSRPQDIDPRELAHAISPPATESLPPQPDFVQVVGMYDAANGSVRQLLYRYAAGRNDPKSPLGSREYLVAMDRYCGFVYSTLAEQLLRQMAQAKEQRVAVVPSAQQTTAANAGRLAGPDVSTASAPVAPAPGAPAPQAAGPGFSSSKTDFLK